VFPEVDDSIEIDINPSDVRTDTYRASGAGGQHINKTDSAVRLTHVPTGIVVQCQNDRSQHRNKDEAWSMLRARLYEAELRKRQSEQQKLEDAKSDIGWGHQIRSYVLDQSRIKDLRTSYEVGNTQAVLDGDLDGFIQASLKQGPLKLILGGRYDSAQHFVISAALAAWAGEPLAEAIGTYKELADARHGYGFSFADLAADRAGTAFGELLVARSPRVAALLASEFSDADLLPPLDGLPEYLRQREFRQRFGGPGQPAYEQQSAEIERRLQSMPLYRPNGA
jgi:hypothetical protein